MERGGGGVGGVGEGGRRRGGEEDGWRGGDGVRGVGAFVFGCFGVLGLDLGSFAVRCGLVLELAEGDGWGVVVRGGVRGMEVEVVKFSPEVRVLGVLFGGVTFGLLLVKGE